MKQTEKESEASFHGPERLRKVTVTLSQEMYERLIRESAKRKIEGAPNQMLSALLREALSQYLDNLELAR